MTIIRRQLGPRSDKTRREGGTVAIEFALVFVLFFVIMYGVVAYGLVFAIRHSLDLAANEGARAAVKDVGGLDARIDLATTTARNAIAWLGPLAPAPVVTAPPCPNATRFTCVTVTLTFNYAANPIVPPLPAMGIVLPATISAQATVQLDAVG